MINRQERDEACRWRSHQSAEHLKVFREVQAQLPPEKRQAEMPEALVRFRLENQDRIYWHKDMLYTGERKGNPDATA